MKTSKNYKVRCTGYNGVERCFTKGKIYEVKDGSITNDNGFTYIPTFNIPDPVVWLKRWYNFEVVEDKIVITHDGKTTTATMYKGDMKHVGIAKCSPEDTFDFNYGAKLAMERLMKEVEEVKSVKDETEWRVVNRKPKKGDYIRLLRPSFTFNEVGDILKVYRVLCDNGKCEQVYGATVLEKDHPRGGGKCVNKPDYEWNYLNFEFEVVERVVSLDGFKVGDRVSYYGHNATVICLSEYNEVGIEFDRSNEFAIHSCGGIKLKDGTTGKHSMCKWALPKELKHIETPKEDTTKDKEPKFKRGQKVKVVKKITHKFSVGDTVEVLDYYEDFMGLGNTVWCLGYCKKCDSYLPQMLEPSEIAPLP